MISCIDVGYRERHAIAACVLFERWTDANPASEFTARVEPIAEYVSGEFYRRELPCILEVLQKLPAPPELIVIDGYIWLEAQSKKGLGAHLYDALNGEIPIVGVAKTRFQTADALEVVRGSKSKSPLFVTAIGIDRALAGKHIQSMHGDFRIPTLLKRVDELSRSG